MQENVINLTSYKIHIPNNIHLTNLESLTKENYLLMTLV